MLSKFPQRLTGILGDDAKLSFRTQPGGIRKLAESRVRNIVQCLGDLED